MSATATQFETAREHAEDIARRAHAAKPDVRYAIAQAIGTLAGGYYVGGYVEEESRYVPVAYVVSGREAYGMNFELIIDGKPASLGSKWEVVEPRPTLEDIKAVLSSLGFRPSVGSWEDENRIFVFSIELAGPATYGAAQCTLNYDKASGKLYQDNREIPFAVPGRAVSV